MNGKQDKKARRDMRAKARRNGDPMGLLHHSPVMVNGLSGDMLLMANLRGRNKFNKINGLNKAIDDGDKQAARAYRAMHNTWFNRDMKPGDWFADGSAKSAVGKEKRRGRSAPPKGVL